MKKTLAAIASASVLFCAPGLVRAASPAPNDPAVAAASKELLATMKAREMMRAVLAQMEGQMHRDRMVEAAKTIVDRKLAPEQQAEELRNAKAKLQAADAGTHAELSDPAMLDDMMGALAAVYADTYTLDEIRQMTDFYASPLGQKMQANAPALMKWNVDIARWFVMARQPKIAVEGGQAVAGK